MKPDDSRAYAGRDARDLKDMAAKILTDTAIGIAHIPVFPGDARELEHIELVLIGHRNLAAVRAGIGLVPPGQ